MKILPSEFDGHAIRRVYDEATETWWFSVVDIVQVLTRQPDYQAARNCWKALKNRLSKEGGQSVTNCHRLKLPAADGKNYLTDVATARQARKALEAKTGKPVVSGENFLPPGKSAGRKMLKKH